MEKAVKGLKYEEWLKKKQAADRKKAKEKKKGAKKDKNPKKGGRKKKVKRWMCNISRHRVTRGGVWRMYLLVLAIFFY